MVPYEDGKMKHVTDYFLKIFEKDFETENVIPLGETPGGYTEMSKVKFFSSKFLLMTTSIEHNSFNEKNRNTC